MVSPCDTITLRLDSLINQYPSWHSITIDRIIDKIKMITILSFKEKCKKENESNNTTTIISTHTSIL